MHFSLAHNIRHTVAMYNANLSYRLITQCLACLDRDLYQETGYMAAIMISLLASIVKTYLAINEESIYGERRINQK